MWTYPLWSSTVNKGAAESSVFFFYVILVASELSWISSNKKNAYIYFCRDQKATNQQEFQFFLKYQHFAI